MFESPTFATYTRVSRSSPPCRRASGGGQLLTVPRAAGETSPAACGQDGLHVQCDLRTDGRGEGR
jgi:hypothetical protein